VERVQHQSTQAVGIQGDAGSQGTAQVGVGGQHRAQVSGKERLEVGHRLRRPGLAGLEGFEHAK